ncbi:MAG: hypothetical protein LBM63_02880 [Rikenellaceae bacterium]|jgi:hypothetical protein|nr:hypothetical protein [Rikenellaceae bacterium]
MTTLIIREDSPEARHFLKYAKTLPFVEERAEKKSFDEASVECNAISLEEFGNRLHGRITELYRNAQS